MNQKSLKHLKAAQEYQAIGNSSKAQKHELRANELQLGGFFPNTAEIERKIEKHVKTLSEKIEILSEKIESSRPLGSGSRAAETHIEISNALNKENYDLRMEVQRLKHEIKQLKLQNNELNPSKEKAYQALQNQLDELTSSNKQLGVRFERQNDEASILKQKLSNLNKQLDSIKSILST